MRDNDFGYMRHPAQTVPPNHKFDLGDHIRNSGGHRQTVIGVYFSPAVGWCYRFSVGVGMRIDYVDKTYMHVVRAVS